MDREIYKQLIDLCLWCYKMGYSDAINILNTTYSELNSTDMQEKFRTLIDSSFKNNANNKPN